MIPQGHIPTSAEPGAHEGSEANVRAIARVAGVIGLCLVAMVALLLLFYRQLGQDYQARTSEMPDRVTTAELPPKPRPEALPLADLLAVRAAEDQHLTRYAWVNHEQGLAQVPIDRAMVLWLRSYASAPLNQSAPPPNASGAVSAASAVAGDISTPSTNAAPGTPVPPVTELQLRQQKAEESTHAR